MNNVKDILNNNNFINSDIKIISARCSNFTHTHRYDRFGFNNMVLICKKCSKLYCRGCISHDNICVDCIHQLSIDYCEKCGEIIRKLMCCSCKKLILKCESMRNKCENDMDVWSDSENFAFCSECKNNRKYFKQVKKVKVCDMIFLFYCSQTINEKLTKINYE